MQKISYVSVLIIFILGISVIPNSYADHTIINVDILHGSSVSGCEENGMCFNPP